MRQPQTNDGGVRQRPFAAILGKQRQHPWLRAAFVKHLNRLAPRQLLRVVDLAEVKHMPLHHAPVSHALVLDNAEVAVLLAILLPNHLAQEHAAELAATANTAMGQVFTTAVSALCTPTITCASSP